MAFGKQKYNLHSHVFWHKWKTNVRTKRFQKLKVLGGIMAIIQCPECSAKISSNAKNCIHCGCEFKVCEECGNGIVGNPEACPSCGFTCVKENTYLYSARTLDRA